MGRSIFSEMERVGNCRLRRFTGDYDLFGNQVFTEGQLIFDSVGRFKGQEAPAVILVDMDAPGPPGVRDTRLVFSGMTRATVRLEILLKRGSWPAEAML